MIALVVVLVALASACLTLAACLLLERGQLIERAREASERLYAAWKAGYVIPEIPGETIKPELDGDSMSDLIPDLQAVVAEWEGPEAQAAQLQYIRSRLAMGLTQAAVLREVGPAPVVAPDAPEGD